MAVPYRLDASSVLTSINVVLRLDFTGRHGTRDSYRYGPVQRINADRSRPVKVRKSVLDSVQRINADRMYSVHVFPLAIETPMGTPQDVPINAPTWD